MDSLFYVASALVFCSLLGVILHVFLITLPEAAYVQNVAVTGELVELTFHRFIGNRLMLCTNEFGEVFYIHADFQKLRGKLVNNMSIIKAHVKNYDGVFYE